MKKKIRIIEEKKKSDFWITFSSILCGTISLSFIMTSVIFFLLSLMFPCINEFNVGLQIYFIIFFCIAWITSNIAFALSNREYETITKEKEVFIEEIKPKRKKK